MLKTIRPYGAVVKHAIIYKFERDGKFYVYDKAYNKYQIEEKEYQLLKVEIYKKEEK